MKLAHCLIDGEWHYIPCEMRNFQWYDIKTGHKIERQVIYNIEKID